MMSKKNTEVEIRFINIDKEKLIEKLRKLRINPIFSTLFHLISFYGPTGSDRDFIRIRNEKDQITLTHKITNNKNAESEEYELIVDSVEKAFDFIKSLGFNEKVVFEKHRTRYIYKNIFIDIDVCPKIPPFVEFEGNSEKDLIEISTKLGFNKKNAMYGDMTDVYKVYGINMTKEKNIIFSKKEKEILKLNK